MKLDRRARKAAFIEETIGRIPSKKLAAKLRKPISRVRLADIVLTERCNSRCKYCLCWKVKDIPEPTTKEVENILDSLARLGTRIITLAGGEPFLRKDLTHLVHYAAQYGIKVNVTTNGIIATPNRVNKLFEAGLDSLTWSIDTLDPEIYEFVRGVSMTPVMRNLKQAIRNKDSFPEKATLNISCVISRHTIDSVKDVVRFSTDNDMSVNIQVVHPAWYSEWFDKDHQYSQQVQFTEEDEPKLEALVDDLIRMRQEGYNIVTDTNYLRGIPAFGVRHAMPENFHCLSGYDSISINVGLDVYSCIDAGIMGNLRENNLEDLWFSKEWQKHRNKMWGLQCNKCWIICHTEGLPDTYDRIRR
jgi:MoaA/NifB/PqqE/SkfB family radical SAM enzyme